MSKESIWVDDVGPRLLAALPCEDGAVSAAMADGRVSIQRVYYDLYADEFPASFECLNVATLWMGGTPGRQYRVGVRLSAPDGTVLAEAAVAYQGQPEPATGARLFHLSSDGVLLMRLPTPGRYSVDVLLDGVPVFTFPIHAIELAEGGAQEESE